MKVDDIPVTSIEDVTQYFATIPSTQLEVVLTIGLLEKTAMYEDDGLPLMYFDQLSTISKHLKNIKYGHHDTIHHDNINQDDYVKGPVLIKKDASIFI